MSRLIFGILGLDSLILHCQKSVILNYPNMKEKIIIILCALVCAMSTMAQTRQFSARVISASDSIPVEFATIKLMQRDSIMVNATLTDENGIFKFDAPIYNGMYLTISSVGYKSLDVALPCDSVIYLENSNELSEVVVRGRSHQRSPVQNAA